MPVKVKAPHETTVNIPNTIQHHNLTHVPAPKKPKSNIKKFLIILGVIIIIAILVIIMLVTG